MFQSERKKGDFIARFPNYFRLPFNSLFLFSNERNHPSAMINKFVVDAKLY
jgi:hypothetical protein